MLRRHFILASLPVALHPPARAQEQFTAGRHYVEVTPRQPTRDRRQVEVVEFFAYGCSHCHAFEPAVDAWQKKLPRDVAFRRIPVAFREDFVIHQRLYFAIETLDMVEQLHRKVFLAIHSERERLASTQEIAAFAARHGADGKRLVETLGSFGVAGKVKQATALASGYRIEGTPSMGVEGRWLTSGALAGSNDRSLAVADYLIALARKDR